MSQVLVSAAGAIFITQEPAQVDVRDCYFDMSQLSMGFDMITTCNYIGAALEGELVFERNVFHQPSENTHS